MNKILAIAILSFKEGISQRIVYGSIIFAIIAMTMALLFSGLFLRDILKIIIESCLSIISLGGLMVPFFLATSMLAGDIEKKSLFTILALPVTRAQYIQGKFLGLCMLTATVMTAMTAIMLVTIYGATLILPSHFFTNLSFYPIFIAVFMNILGIIVLTSTVLLWSSITTSSFITTLLTIATYIIGQSTEEIARLTHSANSGIEVSPVVKTTIKVALYIFPNLASFDYKHQAAYGLSIGMNQLSYSLIYGGSYLVVILTLAILFFKRRNLS